MAHKPLLTAFLLLLAAFPSLAQQGLLAHFACDEGSGDVTKDTVSALTGSIHGATFVKSGDGYCLSFDGVDDYVDCGNPPALSPPQAISLEVWVRPDKVPAGGEPGIAGKAYHNYALTYYQDGKVWWYIGDSTVHVNAPVSPGAWHHVVGTYGTDGVMNLYVDGDLGAAAQGKAAKIPATENFFLGTSKGDVKWTQGKTFSGQIDEVRVWDRALTPAEIKQAYLTTKLTHQVEVTATAAYAARQIIARMDLRGLGELPPGATLQLTLTPRGQKRAVSTQKLANLTSYGKVGAVIGAAKLAPGDYDLTVQSLAAGKPFGHPATVAVTWPKPPKWQLSDPHTKVLNNFVSELRNVSNLRQDTRIDFTNPREGWVYFASQGAGAGMITVTVPAAGDLAQVSSQKPGQQPFVEAMRRLPAGKHDLLVTCSGGATVKNLVVRSIPEIGYCRVDCGPQLTPYGPTDWAFLEKYVLPNINLAVSRGTDDRATWEAWKAQGKRWIVETPLPGIRNDEAGLTADKVFDYWANYAKIDEPLLDGMIVDEFGAGDQPIWQDWHAALKRLRDDPRFKSKVFYPYCGPLYPCQASREFAQTCLDAGWAMALERYLPEEHTELDARAALQGPLVTAVQEWAKVQPEIVPHLLIVTGFLISTPPEGCNSDPSVDYKAFMDLQMNVMANDPALFGMYGVTSYLSAYSEEEIIRWMARLYRHYCIEGRGDRLTDYYELTHLRNPDFDQGLDDWKVEAAEAGGVRTGTMPGFSFLQGRYPPTHRGDNFLVMRRGNQAANRVTQVATGLKPGQTYSLKMISADYGDLQKGISKAGVLPVRVEVQGVEMIPEHTFQYPFKSCYSHLVGPFNAQNPACFNMHNLTFRAKSPTATVVITDEAREGQAAGAVGQEIACNFLELQPYYLPE